MRAAGSKERVTRKSGYRMYVVYRRIQTSITARLGVKTLCTVNVWLVDASTLTIDETMRRVFPA